MGHRLPIYQRNVSPVAVQDAKISGDTLQSFKQTSAVVSNAMQSVAASMQSIANTSRQISEEKRQAVIADQMSNFQVGVYSAIAGHYDTLRDNADPDSYQDNLTKTIDAINTNLLPKVTDPKAAVLAQRFIAETAAEAQAKTEIEADAVRKDIRVGNLNNNLTELIRLGRVDRIEPLIDAAVASRDISRVQASKMKKNFFEVAKEENYSNLKDAYLSQAQEMGYDEGIKYLMNPKNTPGLEAKDRQELQSSLNISRNIEKSILDEQTKKQQELERDDIYSAINAGQEISDKLDKSTLTAGEKQQIREKAEKIFTIKAQEADRDLLFKAIADGSITDDIIDQSALDENEQQNFRELAAKTKKATAEASELPYKQSDNKTKLSIQQKIDTDKPITVPEIYSKVGKGLSVDDARSLTDRLKERENITDNSKELDYLYQIDTGKKLTAEEIYSNVDNGLTVDTAKSLVDRLKKRDKEPYRQTVKFMLDDLEALQKSGAFIFGTGEKTDNNKYDELSTEQRLKNQRIFTAIHKEFTSWVDNHPEATDAQIQEKYKSLVEPVNIKVGLWPWGKDSRQQDRNKKMWEDLEAQFKIDDEKSVIEEFLMDEETEPQTYEEFTNIVRAIEDETEAKNYYNKWVYKWQ